MECFSVNSKKITDFKQLSSRNGMNAYQKTLKVLLMLKIIGTI